MSQLFVAEVKLASPFGFKSEKDFDYLFSIAEKYGDWISIHTSPQWNGSWDMLKAACERSSKPILAKGIHPSDRDVDKAIMCGANAALVVGRRPSDEVIPYTWLEPLDFSQIIDIGCPIVVNRRNLKDGRRRDIPTIQVESDVIVASFIRSMDDVPESCNGFIVGEHLESFCEQLELTSHK